MEWEDRDGYILSRRNSLFHVSKLSDTPLHLLDFPAPFFKVFLCKYRMFQRLFRFMFYNVLKLDDGTIFMTFGNEIAYFKNSKIKKINIEGKKFRVLRSGCAYDNKNSIFFGEYSNNENKDPVNIYKFDIINEKINIVYTFKNDTIRHIHGIYYDKFADKLWCVTGDDLRECKIINTKDNFKTIEVLGEGDESWRCVSLIFTKNYIYYGTDSEFQQNFLYRVCRKTRSRKKLAEVNGPVYYSKLKGDNIFFATTAELRRGDKGSIYKGITPTIYGLQKNDDVTKVFLTQKDSFSPIYFMPGSIHFSRGDSNDSELYFYCVGVEKYDNKAMSLLFK